MAKKKIELPQEEGVTKRITGKSYSQVLHTQYNLTTIEGTEAYRNNRERLYQSLQDHLNKVEKQCIDELNDYLSSTDLRAVNDRYKGTDYKLSDAYFLENGCLCYFELKTLSQYRELSCEYDKNYKHWEVESLKRHKQGIAQPDVIELRRPLLKGDSFSTKFKLDHDRFETLAEKMLYKIRVLSDENNSIEKRLGAAISYGETKQLYDVYLHGAQKQSQRSNGNNRNALATDTINDLVRSNPQEQAQTLWDNFIGDMDAQESLNDKKNIYCSYFDEKTNSKKSMTFSTFQNKVTKAKKKLI